MVISSIISLLTKLTFSSPPYRDIGEALRLDSTWRNFRKRLGLPASSDVGILANLLITLRCNTEHQLGSLIDSVVTAFPLLPGLCFEDIDDALDYAGLNPLTDRKLYNQPHETSAAYAGYGLGLCKNYTDVDLCHAQEKELPPEHTLAVSYTQKSMIVVLTTMERAYMYYEPDSSYIVDHEAGLGALKNYPNNHNAYWDHVRVRLMQLTLEPYTKRRIEKVLLLGESALDETFLEVVKDAMYKLQGDLPKIYMDNPLHVAARGAAEFAKRAQESRADWMVYDTHEL